MADMESNQNISKVMNNYKGR
ncbi:hypothetical protein DERF_003930 [Dermatophagoides farinae]|uniref:Uncharacterized protein n=1 Tax=Dermatophagoides farinae TaxID=6954 RepID=A0A922LB32_DERFA|nr:hypothetical protein DERF_003930 [Dermatophagoides farinae]